MAVKIAHWDNHDIRDNGTGKRMAVALAKLLGGRDTFRRMRRPPRPEHDDPNWADFNIMCDDGRDDIEFMPPSPNALWCIDTHLGYETRHGWAKNFDYVFCAQKTGVEKMKADGLKEVYWLPLACSPQVDINAREAQKLGINNVNKATDVCFVGHLNRGHGEEGNDRVDYLDALFAEFPNFTLSFKKFFGQAAIRYIRSKIGFNVSITDDLNMRFFEAMSYGTALLTNRNVIGIEDMDFEEDVHYFAYEGKDEMVEKAHWMIDNEPERERVALQGHKLARDKHTYEDRMMELLKVCGLSEALQ
jgi:hypothetical protein